MNGIRNNHQLLVICILAVPGHSFIGVFTEITGMGFLTVNQKNGASDLMAVLENGLVCDVLPAACGSGGILCLL